MNQILNQTALENSHSVPDVRPPTRGSGDRVAFIQACWHKEIVDQCRIAFMEEAERLGLQPASIDVFETPGSFEIPLQAKTLAGSGRYAAIVAAGLIVDGGVYRHEFVADAVISALMRLQMEVCVPVISAVLTPQRFHDHEDHRRFFRDHFLIKGREAAQACMRTIDNIAAARKAA
ncbi:6,7-dimethyl-8-ribityllumazine synthase [Terrarubrum flagellatum]|uniref:6,7-dimethyl-8-ribityllumazine synthase n=1 Tax=Terrirubrum flagellatum TaxID=2895980 RepID=UPI0031450016